MEDGNPTFPSYNFRELNVKDSMAFLKIDKRLQIFYKYRIMRPLMGGGGALKQCLQIVLAIPKLISKFIKLLDTHEV